MSAELSPPTIAKRRTRTAYFRAYMAKRRADEKRLRAIDLYIALKDRFEGGASSMSEEYVGVTAFFLRATEKAVLLAPERHVPGKWIPRSCVHGADERAIDKLAEDQEVTLRIFEWIAKREGLI